MQTQKKETKQDTKQKKSFTDILTDIVAIPIGLSPLFIFIGIFNDWWILFFIGLGLLAIGICCYLYSNKYKPQGKTLEEKLEYAFNDTTGDSAFWWFDHLKEKPNNGDKNNIHLLHEKFIKIEPKNSSTVEWNRISELRKKFILHVLPDNIDYTKKKYYVDKSVIKRMCTSKQEYVDCIWDEYELTCRLIIDESWRSSDFLSPFYTVCYWELFSDKKRAQIPKDMYNSFLKKVNSNYIFKDNKFVRNPNKLDEDILNNLEYVIEHSINFYYDEEKAKQLDEVLEEIKTTSKRVTVKNLANTILKTIEELEYCPYSPTAKYIQDYKLLPQDGVYIFFDKTEQSLTIDTEEIYPRIVYVGINDKKGRFLERLNCHFNGNNGNSTLRNHISSCFPVDSSNEEISNYIKTNLYFQAVNVPNFEERDELESMLISTFNEYNEFGTSSNNWLGKKSDKFKNAKLWNVQKLNEPQIDKNYCEIYSTNAVTSEYLKKVFRIKPTETDAKTFDTFLEGVAKENEEKLKNWNPFNWKTQTSTSSSFDDFEEKQKELEWKMELKEKMEKRAEERKRQDREYQERRAQSKAEEAAIQRCARCANYNSCGKGRNVINCGSFVPKKYN